MKVVGVVACPLGLAHTPMAAKALEKAGQKMGLDIKMEQQASTGLINKIMPEDVKDADFVLIASDQMVREKERFEGKKIITIPIATCIKAPEAVLKKCIQAIEK